MTGLFENPERAAEARFARDEDAKFRALARRDKLFALWASGRLHLRGAAHDRLVSGLLAVQGYPQHEAAMLAFLASSPDSAPLPTADATAALHRLGEAALEQVLTDTATPIDLAAQAYP